MGDVVGLEEADGWAFAEVGLEETDGWVFVCVSGEVHPRGRKQKTRATSMEKRRPAWCSAEKSRVRAISSDAVVGLKNVCWFRRYGVKGAETPCRVWGGTPRKQEKKRSWRRRKGRIMGFVVCGVCDV